MRLKVKRLKPGVEMPTRAHDGDAGLDLQTAESVVLKPGERAKVPCGIAVEIPDGCAGLVVPRSGLAAKRGLGLVNSPGLIDAHYRGEVSVILVNHDRNETIRLKGATGSPSWSSSTPSSWSPRWSTS